MKNRVQVLQFARIEVLEAAEYFDQLSEELGNALVNEFQHVLEQISEFPLSVPLVQEPIRKRPMFRFPYNVYYLFPRTRFGFWPSYTKSVVRFT